MKDIRAELRARLEAVRAQRTAAQTAYRARDAELAARETRLAELLKDEEQLWTSDSSSETSVNGTAPASLPTPSLTALALEFLYESDGTGRETRIVAAAAQNRGYRFKPKGAARAMNMALQGLARNNFVICDRGLWFLTPEGRAEAQRSKMEKESTIAA